MKIAPIDIAHKTFTRKMMGLDTDEVMDFLRLVAAEMEGLVRDRNTLRESLREKELAIIEYRERDELLKSTITTVTKMSDRIQQDAERESRLILNDARQQSEMIVRDARDSLKKIFQEISDLKKIRMQYENNMRALIQSQLSMIEQGHKLMPDPELEISAHIRAGHQGQTVAQSLAASQGQHGQNHGQQAPAYGQGQQQPGGHTAHTQQTAQRDVDAIRSNVTEAVKNSIRPLNLDIR